jgi:hypothetical protein
VGASTCGAQVRAPALEERKLYVAFSLVVGATFAGATFAGAAPEVHRGIPVAGRSAGALLLRTPSALAPAVTRGLRRAQELLPASARARPARGQALRCATCLPWSRCLRSRLTRRGTPSSSSRAPTPTFAGAPSVGFSTTLPMPPSPPPRCRVRCCAPGTSRAATSVSIRGTFMNCRLCSPSTSASGFPEAGATTRLSWPGSGFSTAIRSPGGSNGPGRPGLAPSRAECDGTPILLTPQAPIQEAIRAAHPRATRETRDVVEEDAAAIEAMMEADGRSRARSGASGGEMPENDRGKSTQVRERSLLACGGRP